MISGSPVRAMRSYPVRQILIAVLAITAGLLVAFFSIESSLTLIVLVGYVILSLVSPYAAMLFMLVLAPLRALIATESALTLPLDIGQICFMGLLAAVTLNQIARKERLWLFGGWQLLHGLLAVFIAATGLSAFTGQSLSAWIAEWTKWVQILLLALLVTRLRANWQWVVFALLVAGAANALVGIYQFFGGSGADHLLINDRFFRAFGTFGQPNPFGGFLGLLLPIGLMAAYGYGLRWWQQVRAAPDETWRNLVSALFYGSASVLLAVGILFSWSRGAWLASTLALAVMAFALPHRLSYSVLVAGVVVSAVLLLWFSGRLPASVVERITTATADFFAFEDMRGVDITPENYAVVERLAHWQAAFNMIEQNPWSGVGFGAYEAAYADYRLLNWHEPLGHAHNYYLNIWAEGGMISLLAYGLLWFGVVLMTWRIRSHPDTLARSVGIGLLGTWTYLSIHSLLDNLYVNNLFLHLGVMFGIMGLLYNQVRYTRVVRGS